MLFDWYNEVISNPIEGRILVMFFFVCMSFYLVSGQHHLTLTIFFYHS